MTEHRSELADWVVPAILVGVAVALVIVFTVVFIVTGADRSEPEGLAEQLDAYTRCLNDHGADVPRVEARRDGGFSIPVSGSMIENGFDPAAWFEAHGACGEVAPDLFGGIFGVLTDGMLGGVAGGMPGPSLEGVFEDLVGSA